MEIIDVLAICGSTREKSFNRALTLAARDLAPDPFRVEVWDDHTGLPHVEAAPGRPFPAAVGALRDRVSRADILLLVTPELNRNIPGRLKDIVDWLSVPAPPRPLMGRPVMLMSASPNRFGGAFAQLQLADLLRRAGAEVLTDLDVTVGSAHRHVDDAGNLVGEEPRHEVAQLWRRLLARTADGRQAVPV
ncbi:chromate reductase [Streptosporangium album]|uniref:Chromate reductase n=1 Tax=Streptosporangium album TaxID=47479 RepID=A0A7W7RR86_9ACTN|nr:NAD(P)H-dependent oxidoreductase [Streptosporangium album]MBB4936669.1 chromate reductase [Streptosporangium album]